MKARTSRSILALAGVVVALGLASPAMTQVQFESFSEVENVCPDCEQPESDTVTLAGGETIRCNIVAENNDFLVVERYGEVRGLPLQKVDSKSFADGNRPSNLKSQDQIVLKNGHVLTGSIVDESDQPGHFQLKSSIGDFSYVVFKSEARALYRKGSKKTIQMPEDDGESSSSGAGGSSSSSSDSSSSTSSESSESSDSSESSSDFESTGEGVDSPDFPE